METNERDSWLEAFAKVHNLETTDQAIDKLIECYQAQTKEIETAGAGRFVVTGEKDSDLPLGIRKGDDPNTFFVTSSKGDKEYFVDLDKGTCGCPDATMRNKTCKHIKNLREIMGGPTTPGGITAGENEWFEKVGNEAAWEDLTQVIGEKRIKELVELGELFIDKPGHYKRLK